MLKLVMPEGDLLTWNLDELVEAANERLPEYLPQVEKGGRMREGVNRRLVRYYTTLGLLDEPLKEKREARYTRRHLWQLLALRKLMAEGYVTSALEGLLKDRTDQELESLAEGTSRIEVAALQHPGKASGTHEQYRWLRLEVERGLELQVREDFRPPKSPRERQHLLDRLAALVDGVAKS